MNARHITFTIIAALFCASLFFLSNNFHYERPVESAIPTKPIDTKIVDVEVPATSILDESNKPFVATHIETPNPVRAIYMSSWVAGTESIRNHVISLVDSSEINAVVIDIKDDTGKISFEVNDETLRGYQSFDKRIRNIDALIADLHERNIYVIGRIAVFQDPYLAKAMSKNAVQTPSGAVWKDKKGLSWMDAGSQDVWDYIVAIARESYSRGFDEINLDYVRFPTDGHLESMVFPISKGRVRKEVIGEFFAYMDEKIRKESKIPLSADVFGLVTESKDDLGIGQVLEVIAPHVDYISPMIYPSHYAKGYRGIAEPAKKPREVVTFAMQSGINRMNAIGEPITKLRPWLQDFDLGAIYNKDMVVAQQEGVEDLGIMSWLMWDPANTYTRDAYEKIQVTDSAAN